MKLRVATSQFAVSGDSKRNCRTILRQMAQAKQKRADIIHFSETALSGYSGCDFDSFKGFDWAAHTECMMEIMALAGKLKLWVVLGSSHRLTGKHKPHNCLYIIDDKGKLVDRYDKMFCTGGDLKHYSPGTHLCVFSVKGVKCGALICHDLRYQELYREYLKRGVRLMFHSYHNIRLDKKQFNAKTNVHGMIVPATMQTYAANNNMFISSNNSSRKESSWASFAVLPDGFISGKLKRNKAGLLITAVDTKKHFYDASKGMRLRAMKGVYHSGTPVKDIRSRNRKQF